MLVLTRHIDETILIGKNIRVTVLDVRGSQVKLGIDAPRDVPVHRQEIAERIEADKATLAKLNAHLRGEM